MRTLLASVPSVVETDSGAGAAASRHCLECPGTRHHLLNQMIGESSSCCEFENLAVEPRESIPLRWFSRFTLGIVRRGALVRQRADAQGRVTAIDVVGPGCAFPIDVRDLELSDGGTCAGYAVTRTLICAADERTVNDSLQKGGQDALDLHRLQREALYRMERIADARGRSAVASRVAALTCTLADTLVRGPRERSHVPAGFLLRDYAALLSIRHESVCRVLRDFSRKGLTSQDDEGLHILDRKGLENV